ICRCGRGAAQIRFAHDFEQRHAGSIEVDGRRTRKAVVYRFARILLEMRAGDPDIDHSRIFVDSHTTACRDGAVELRDLVSFRKVRVEIVLACEDGRPLYLAAERQRRADRQLDRVIVEDWQRTRQREAHRTRVGVRRRAKVRRATAEDLRGGLELDVDLEPHNHLVAVTRRLQFSARPSPLPAHSPSARSSAYAAANMRRSAKRGAMSWPPTGRPSICPIGCDIAGTPAKFAGQVKTSLKYISYGSDFEPIGNAVVGVVGVNRRSTPLANTVWKSRAMRERTCCAFR